MCIAVKMVEADENQKKCTAGEPTQANNSGEEKQPEDHCGTLAAQKQAKKPLVISTIANKCQESEFPVMKAIKAGLEEGDELCADDVVGSNTNFCYKVYLKCDPSVALFTKLSFAFAMWSPDKNAHYDLERCENEFKIQKSFAKMTGGPGKAPIAELYYLLDTEGGKSKLLIAEWCKGTDVQFSDQILRGTYDKRVVVGFAKAMAVLNLAPADDNWNEACRSCFLALEPATNQIMAEYCAVPDDEADDCIGLFKELGFEKCKHLNEAFFSEYRKCREALSHNDTKPWNILVEPTEMDGSFGPTGKFVICDWEMSIKGKLGLDLGIFISLPVVSAYIHAVKGHEREARELVNVIPVLWNAYSDAIKAQDPSISEESFLSAYMGMLGGFYLWMLWGYYAFGFHAETFPIEGLAEHDVKRLKGAMGYVGLKCGEVVYDEGNQKASLSELRKTFEQLLESKLDELFVASS